MSLKSPVGPQGFHELGEYLNRIEVIPKVLPITTSYLSKEIIGRCYHQASVSKEAAVVTDNITRIYKVNF